MMRKEFKPNVMIDQLGALRTNQKDDALDRCIEQLKKLPVNKVVALNEHTPLEVLNAFYEIYVRSSDPIYNDFLKVGLPRKEYDKFIRLKRIDDDKQIPKVELDGEKFNITGHWGRVHLRRLSVENIDDAKVAAKLGNILIAVNIWAGLVMMQLNTALLALIAVFMCYLMETK